MAHTKLWISLLLLQIIFTKVEIQAFTSGRKIKSITESNDAVLIQDIVALLEIILFIAKNFTTPLPVFDNNGNVIPFYNYNTSGNNDVNISNTFQSNNYLNINDACTSSMSSYTCSLKRPSFGECSSCGYAHKVLEGTESGSGWGGIIRILYLKNDNTIAISCSGWLITPTLVGTAGHCVWDIDNGGGWLIAKYRIIAYSRYNGKNSAYTVAQVVKTWTTNTFLNTLIKQSDKLSQGADLGLMKLRTSLSKDSYSWTSGSGGSAFYKAYGYPAEFQYAPGDYMYYWNQNLDIRIGCLQYTSMFCSTIGTIGGMSGGPLFEVVNGVSYVVGSLSSGSTCLCRTYHTPVEGQYSISSLVKAVGCTVNCVSSVCTANC